MKRALITGILGQDGIYLSKLLIDNGYQVFGIDKNTKNVDLKYFKYLGIDKNITFIETNLLDLSSIIKTVENYQLDEIYNLAAQSSVGLSFKEPINTLEFNILSVANILEAIRIVNPKIKFYQASSSEMFGMIPKNKLPITESYLFHPVSPYAISKASSHWITINYREAYGIYAVCGVLFNHESVFRNHMFVTKKIINTAVNIAMGKSSILELGNLNVQRDWGYAPEYIKAMWLMLQQENPSDYLICSGEANSLQYFVDKVFDILNLDKEKYIKINPKLFRPVDLDIIYGDNSKAKKELGWEYDMKFDELITKLVEDEKEYIEWKMKKGIKND